MKLGLENIAGLLARLGHPQERFPAILVAGTNGKGSVTAFVSSMLRSAGLDVGTFYSPHLFRINERIRLNGDEIPSPVLDALLGELREHFEETTFTFFEGVTAAAILYFARRRVDTAVFEVGLGGRLDATRLVNAAVTVITGISLDHREHLGGTKKLILEEKLGIVQEGVPLVANLTAAGLAGAARKACESAGAPFHDVSGEAAGEMISLDAGGMVVDITTPARAYRRCRMRMIGAPQTVNSATAVRTVEVFWDTVGRYARTRAVGSSGPGDAPDILPASYSSALKSKTSRRVPPVGAIREGLAGAFVAGRFQVLPGEPRIVLDVAHNAEALVCATRTLRRISPPARNIIIFGILAHKELGPFPRAAAGSAREIICTRLSDRRTASAEDLRLVFSEAGGRDCSVRAARGMGAAIKTALRSLQRDDTLLILGSHLAVEEAAAHL